MAKQDPQMQKANYGQQPTMSVMPRESINGVNSVNYELYADQGGDPFSGDPYSGTVNTGMMDGRDSGFYPDVGGVATDIPIIPPTDGMTFNDGVVGGGSEGGGTTITPPLTGTGEDTGGMVDTGGDGLNTPISDYVPVEQPDYSGGGSFVEDTGMVDPASATPTAAATAANLGGGAQVGTYAGTAEDYLNENRDLNTIDTGAEARSAAEDAIYGSMASRLDPRFEQEATDLEISLRNRGLSEGDAAFDAAMANFGRTKEDAYKQAAWQSIMGGGQEAQRSQQMDLDRRAQMFGEAMGMSQQEIDKNRNALQAQATQNQYALGMANLNFQTGQADRQYDLQSQQQGFGQQMQAANYQNQLRQQQIQEEMLRRNQSLNELNALLTGAQVAQPNFNQYNQAGFTGGTDYTGAAQNQYQSSLDSFNANNAMWQGLMGGAASMYGSGMFG